MKIITNYIYFVFIVLLMIISCSDNSKTSMEEIKKSNIKHRKRICGTL